MASRRPSIADITLQKNLDSGVNQDIPYVVLSDHGYKDALKSADKGRSSFDFQRTWNVPDQNGRDKTQEHMPFREVMAFWGNMERKISAGADKAKNYVIQTGEKSAKCDVLKRSSCKVETSGPDSIHLEMLPIQGKMKVHRSPLRHSDENFMETSAPANNNSKNEKVFKKLNSSNIMNGKIQEGDNTGTFPCISEQVFTAARSDVTKGPQQGKGIWGNPGPQRASCEEKSPSPGGFHNTNTSLLPSTSIYIEASNLKSMVHKEDTGPEKVDRTETALTWAGASHGGLSEERSFHRSQSELSVDSVCHGKEADFWDLIFEHNLSDESQEEQRSYPQLHSSVSSNKEADQISSQESSDSESSTSEDTASEEELIESSEDNHDDEPFDLKAYIEAICRREEQSDSEQSETNSSSSEALTRRVARKIIKELRKTSAYVASDSESSLTGQESMESDDDESYVESSSDESGIDDEVADNKLCGVEEDVEKETTTDVQDRKNHLDTACSEDVHDDSPIETANKEYAPSLPVIKQGVSISLDENTEDTKALDSKTTSALDWASSNFFYKQRDTLDFRAPLPSYRSKRSSTSVSGKKMNVMLGRVWWVEWWAVEDRERRTTMG